jgi:amino acid transporter
MDDDRRHGDRDTVASGTAKDVAKNHDCSALEVKMSDRHVTDGGSSAAAEQSAAETGPRSTTQALHGRLGTLSIVLTVAAYLAPLGAVAGYVPLVIAYGNGLGAPMIFLLCGVVLSLFSFGYLAMVRQVPRPGAFYSYVTVGLGKRIGLGAGTLTLVYYLYLAVSFYIFGGLATQSTVHADFGLDLPWWVYTGALMLIVGLCSYRGIDFNVRVLGIIVTAEVVVVTTFNLVTLTRGGADGLPAQPFSWTSFTSGSIAIGALFAIGIYTGFESTAIFREEARDPGRTIPRATYAVIAVLTIFYVVTTYCVIAALGAGHAVSATAEDPSGAFGAAAGAMIGSTFSQIASTLVVTSVLASQLAIANVTARYVYSLGVDRVFPSSLGAVHMRHNSPHRASIATLVAAGSVVAVVGWSGIDPHVAYGTFGGVMMFGFEAIVLLVSVAVIVYFRRHRGHTESFWSVIVAPVLTIAGFGWLLYFSASRADLLLGTTTALTPVLFIGLGLAVVVGIGYASWAAEYKRDVYARIGRELQ